MCRVAELHFTNASLVLQGVDRVMCVNAADASTLLLRQYRIRLKKTGTKASFHVPMGLLLWMMHCW